MVATASNPAPQASEPPPTLTSVDAAYLQAVFALDRDLFALADHAKQPLEDVFAWATQPRIQAAIELIARLQADGLKAAALALLRELAETTTDLVERRRALNHIFRALNPPQYRPRSSGPGVPPANPPRPAETPPHGPTRTAAVSERAPSPSDERLTPPPEPPAPDTDDPFSQAASPPATHTPRTQSALEALAEAEHLHTDILTNFGPSLDALDAEEDALEDLELDEEADDDPDDTGLSDSS